MPKQSMTLQEIAEWCAEEGASLHISHRAGAFLVVAHCAGDDRNTHVTNKDLDTAVKLVMADL